MKKVLVFIFLILFISLPFCFKKNNSYISVVSIVSKKRIGTGFVYKKDDNTSYILTNYHVIKNSDEIYIKYNNKSILVNDYRYDDFYDVAILLIENSDEFLPIKLNEKDLVELNDTIEILNYENNIKGKISAIEQEIYIPDDEDEYYYNAIMFNANIDYGYSGSPIVDSNNSVIGMVSVMDENAQIGYAISSKDLMKIVSRLEKNIKKINLGGTFASTQNTDIIIQYGLNANISGVIILDVIEDGILYNSGLMAGDIIVKLNEQKIDNIRDLKKYLNEYSEYKYIDITYYRNSKYNSVRVYLR